MKAITEDFAFGRVLEDVFQHTAQALAAASRGALEPGDVSLALAPAHAEGDFAFRCFDLARAWKKNPALIAQEMAADLKTDEVLSAFTPAGPYLNIHLNRTTLVPRICSAVSEGAETYGHSERQADEVVMMEYISPNTNKPLHLGHIRNGVLGRAVGLLLAAQGAEVKKCDIVNDRGIHIAKSMLAYSRWGEGATPEGLGIKGDHYVGQLYVRFEQELKRERVTWLKARGIALDDLKEREKKILEAEFLAASELMTAAADLLQRWEAEDPEARQLWGMMNSWVYAGFSQTYKRLGLDFDRHYYESEIYQQGKELIQDALEKGLFERAENGAVIAPLSKHFKKLQDKAVLRADGTSLYITQDINLATIKYREYGLTRSIYCIASEQDYYMKQLFAILELLGFPWAEGTTHLSYGMVYLPEGKMKSREGNVVDADTLMEDMAKMASDAIHERFADLEEAEVVRRADTIGVAALTFHFLIVGRDTPIQFDPKASLAFEGKTGPYLLYSYARAASLLRKAGEWNRQVEPRLTEDVAWEICRDLTLFPNVTADAAESLDPSRLASYLIDIAQSFNSFWHDHPVLKAEEPLRSSRLCLVSAFRQVLGNGLRLLGIEPLEEM
jgi:arginyl-tRNA synthetase